jgi:hypothetical protein
LFSNWIFSDDDDDSTDSLLAITDNRPVRSSVIALGQSYVIAPSPIAEDCGAALIGEWGTSLTHDWRPPKHCS